MTTGIVLFRNHKYFYRNETADEHELLRSDLTSILIPGDRIHVENHTPMKILDRAPQYTIAIVRGISSDQVYLYCPLLSPFYNPSIPMSSFQTLVQIGTRLIIYITKETVCLKKIYSLVSDRIQDRQIIDDLYAASEFVLPTLVSPASVSGSEPLYTTPFQDQTDLPTFTVDPHESRDFDDAISIVGNTVYVHIVDIHSQMPSSSAADMEAARLGFTLYTPEGNHNIVQTEKAEYEWSLVAYQERRVITIEIRYNAEFNVEGYDIYPAAIIVKHRYNYENAPLIHLAKVITERVERVLYTIPQLQLTITPSTGQVYQVQQAVNTDMSHRMIETFMVTANMIVSDHLRTRSPSYAKIPQRFHRKLRGLPTHPPTGDPIVDSFLAIKTYAYAVYDPEKCGHYGLNVQSYTHFTSPIRRYFDVIIHRMLAGVQYTDVELQTILDHLNRRELDITALTKLYQQWKLLSTVNVGDTWDVVITRVTAAGVYYLYKPYMMDGFIHVSALGGARWYLRTGDDDVAELHAAPDQRIRHGTCLKCRVANVDWIKQLVTITASPQ